MMNVIPDDIMGTLEHRYVAVRYDTLPETFQDDPLSHLDKLSGVYKEKVARHNRELAKAHNDWSIRVETNSDAAISVAQAAVSQNKQWVQFRGMISRISQPIPLALDVGWRCSVCNNIKTTDPGQKPTKCPCGRGFFERSEADSKFVDTQHILLAEQFEEIAGTRAPRMLPCRLDGTLIQVVNPGDRCIMNGVMTLKTTKAGYDYEFLVNNVSLQEKVEETIPPEIDGDPMEALLDSFATKIHGHTVVKEAIILLMVGGPESMKGRSSINILLVGDPGIAKSVLLKEAANLAPLGRYTSGRGATSAGLTAGMNRDKDGVMYLEAGAAVLTDGGVLCMDEFDKTEKTDRAGLHEVMEQQTVSVAKLGTLVTMHARVSILAAANPKDSSWNVTRDIKENIDLPDSLISRFDLIFNLKDQPNEEHDADIANAILFSTKKENRLSPEDVTAYIRTVRDLDPVMTVEAAKIIKKYFVSARQNWRSQDIKATPRQVEAAHRLAGAMAKVYRRKEITVDDANRAVYLIENMIQKVLLTSETGKTDYARVVAGKKNIAEHVLDLIENSEDGHTAEEVAHDMKRSLPDIEKVINRLHNAGRVILDRHGIYRKV